MTTTDTELPPFLHGSLDWRVNGFHWNEPVPIDLTSREATHSVNPWIVIASAVELAKRGDHSHAAALQPFFDRTEPFALSRVALLVYADIAPTGGLTALEDQLHHIGPRIRAYAAEAAALTGQLNLVPAMLQAWQNAPTLADHETIGFAISDILDDDQGLIREEVGIHDPPVLDGPATTAVARTMAEFADRYADVEPPPFPALVEKALGRLLTSTAPREQIWEGSRMEIERLALKLLAVAKGEESGAGINLRHRFESYTGEDCRDFFHAMRPQMLTIASHMERFFSSDQKARYQVGRRHFFGHPIPDAS